MNPEVRLALEEKGVLTPKEVKKKDTDRSLTKWEAFDEGELIPIQVKCQDYQPIHPWDTSCHTNLIPTANNVVRHMADEHGSGGGFAVQLRHRPGQKTKLWKELSEAKVELHDFRCDVCNEQLPLVPRRVIKHFAAHAGKSRAPRAGGNFWMTLKFDRPDELEEDLD
jgi:hypothetical protein